MHTTRPGFRFVTIVALAAALCGSPGAAQAADGPLCYVDASATSGGNTGNSWGNAYTALQTALAESNCDQIWVANGTYRPTTDTDRTISFVLQNGVGIYGGFHGDPAGENELDDRNWTTNVAILSGDIGTGGDVHDDSYHVVVSLSGTDSTAVLDGFTITAGYAFGASDPTKKGGGIYNYQGSPTLANLRLDGNNANDGAGMYNDSGSPHLTNVTFANNTAVISGGGGGMYNTSGSPVLQDVTFQFNVAGSGGGMYNHESDPSLGNVTFSGNEVYATAADPSRGGGMYNDDSDPTLNTATFSGNSAYGSSSHPGYGGGMYNASGSEPHLTGVTFSNNSTPVYASGQACSGGGMYNDQSSPTLTNVTFSGNASTQAAGMMNIGGTQILTNVNFFDNTATSNGGGMFNSGSVTTLTNVVFSGNSGLSGGGMQNWGGTVTLTDVTFSGNNAEASSGSGGGMLNTCSSPTLTKVTFSGNTAFQGGGITNLQDMGCDPSNPTLTNVTLHGNTAAKGGGVYNSMSSPTLIHVTMAGNSATDAGAGVYNASGSGFIRNSILWNTTGAEIAYPGSSDYLTITDSILEGGCPDPAPTGQTCTNVVGGDPLLVPLDNNGGFTQTMALGAGSAAIDEANGTYCPMADQRDKNRPQDGDQDDLSKCDMGAYEFALYSIYGNTGVGGVTLGYDNGGDQSVTSDDTGEYSLVVPEHWVGTVTPLKTDCSFTDPSIAYNDVTSDLTLQDYAAVCSVTFMSVKTYDGWIVESGENTNVGGTLNSSATSFNLGDDAANKQYRGILSFNTADLPDNAVIDSAKLRIKKMGLTGTDPFLTMNKLAVDIKKSAFSGSIALQLGDFDAAPNLSNAAYIPNNPVNNWYNKVLSSTTFSTINKKGVTQFRLRFTTDDDNNLAADYLAFYTGNNGLARRPQLVLTFHAP